MTSAAEPPDRRETLNLRWRAEDRALIDRAARTRGLTRTDFVLGASRDRAMEVLLDQTYVELDPDGFEAFAERLEAPPAPSERLAAATVNAASPWT